MADYLIKNYCTFFTNTANGCISVETIEWDDGQYPNNIVTYKENVYEKQHINMSKDDLARVHCYFNK